MADPGRHTRAYPFSLSLFTSFSLFRVLQHLTWIPPFPVLTRILHFPVLTRILHSQYSPGSHISGTCLDFYFFGTRPDPTIPVLTRTLLRYSPGSYPFRYSPEFYPSPVLAWIPHFRYSPGFLLFRHSPGFYPFSVLAQNLLLYSPGFHLFLVLAQISTFPALTRILPFFVLAWIFTFPTLARILQFPSTHPDPSSVLARIPPFRH